MPSDLVIVCPLQDSVRGQLRTGMRPSDYGGVTKKSKIHDLDFIVPTRVNAAWSTPYICDLQRRGPKASSCNELEISLIAIEIHHKTTYRFNKPVAIGATA